MNGKIKEFLIDNGLPLPETILYPPLDKVKGNRLIRYEINSSGIFAIVECNKDIEITWTLERVRQCTVWWRKYYGKSKNSFDLP